MLQASLISDDDRSELTAAVTSLKAAKERRALEDEAATAAAAAEPVAPDTRERDRGPELSKRHGWAWLRVFRRYDAYKAALDQLEAAEREEQQAARERDRELV